MIFGDARASRISPMRSTKAREIPFTIHNGAPVVPPDVMHLVSIAVNRKTRSGHVLGPEQRLTVDEALYAVTQASAYAYFEEDRKGSLTAGKQADPVVLQRDPRAVPPAELADVAVLETFSHGRSVFVRAAGASPTASATHMAPDFPSRGRSQPYANELQQGRRGGAARVWLR